MTVEQIVGSASGAGGVHSVQCKLPTNGNIVSYNETIHSILFVFIFCFQFFLVFCWRDKRAAPSSPCGGRISVWMGERRGQGDERERGGTGSRRAII